MARLFIVKKALSPYEYKRAFARRLQQIRRDSGYSQSEFAALLGIPTDTYARYETRTQLPTHLIPEVCNITGHDAWFVLTGKANSTEPKNAAKKTIQARQSKAI